MNAASSVADSFVGTAYWPGPNLEVVELPRIPTVHVRGGLHAFEVKAVQGVGTRRAQPVEVLALVVSLVFVVGAGQDSSPTRSIKPIS